MFEKLNLIHLLTPFMYYNFIAGIIGGGMLILSGEWTVATAGIIFIISAYWILKYLMYLPALLTTPAIYFYQKKNRSVLYLFIFLAVLMRTSFIMLWSFFIFLYLFKTSHSPVIAILLFAYAIINIPLNFLAHNNADENNNIAAYETLIPQTLLLIGIFLKMITNFDIFNVVLFIGIILLGISLWQYISDYKKDEKQKKDLLQSD